MSNKNKKPEEKPEPQVNEKALIDEKVEKVLIAALNKLFTEEKWELPDDCLVGPFKHRLDQLQARVDHLAKEWAAAIEERARLNDEPAAIKGKK